VDWGSFWKDALPWVTALTAAAVAVYQLSESRAAIRKYERWRQVASDAKQGDVIHDRAAGRDLQKHAEEQARRALVRHLASNDTTGTTFLPELRVLLWAFAAGGLLLLVQSAILEPRIWTRVQGDESFRMLVTAYLIIGSLWPLAYAWATLAARRKWRRRLGLTPSHREVNRGGEGSQ